jgi:hypothetical protein
MAGSIYFLLLVSAVRGRLEISNVGIAGKGDVPVLLHIASIFRFRLNDAGNMFLCSTDYDGQSKKFPEWLYCTVLVGHKATLT